MAREKGSENTYIAERPSKTINLMGYRKCAIKCDQEPAMKELQKELRSKLWKDKVEAAQGVVELLGRDRVELIAPDTMDVTLENSPVGESESNGMIETAIQSVQGQIRAIKDTIESEAKMTIQPDDNIWQWMIEYAAYTLLAGKIHPDGKTSLERYRGTQSHQAIVAFGERVHYKHMKTKKDLQRRSQMGIWNMARSQSRNP